MRQGDDADAVFMLHMDFSRTRAIGVRVGNHTFAGPVD